MLNSRNLESTRTTQCGPSIAGIFGDDQSSRKEEGSSQPLSIGLPVRVYQEEGDDDFDDYDDYDDFRAENYRCGGTKGGQKINRRHQNRGGSGGSGTIYSTKHIRVKESQQRQNSGTKR